MSGPKNSKFGKLDAAGFCRFLVAAFPAATANHVAALTGISASTVDKWLRGETRPSADHFAMLLATFGPQFLAAAVPSCSFAREAACHDGIRARLDQISELLGA